mgnify:CR=1 FL=1
MVLTSGGLERNGQVERTSVRSYAILMVPDMAPDTGTTLDAPQSVLTRLNLMDEDHALISRETARYLRDLAQSPLDAIEQQSAQQQASVFSLEHQLSELCVRNTSAFVLTQEAFNKMPHVCAYSNEKLAALSNSHMARILRAIETFEKQANIALTLKKSASSMKGTMETSLLQLLELPQFVSASISNANYEEALQLAQYFFQNIPPKEDDVKHVVQSLLDEMYSVLLHVQHLLMQAFCDPTGKLPEARACVSYLLRLKSFAHIHYPATELDQQNADICFGFLHARFLRAHTCLDPNADILDSIESWKDTVMGACATATSIYLDNRVDQAHPIDTMSVQLIAMFATHAVDVLYAHLSQYLHNRTHAPIGPVANLEEISKEISMVYSKLCFASDTLASVGVPLELSLVPSTGGIESSLNAFDHAALSLWIAALHAIQPEEVSASFPEKETHNHMPRALSLHPVCVGTARQVVAALNVLRHFAPLNIHQAAVDAMGKRFSHILPDLPQDAHHCFISVLAPWASSALVQGVFDQPKQSYSLSTCAEWRQAYTSVKHTALNPA